MSEAAIQNEYMPMFLAEAREHLQELNLAVLRIEEHPDDSATAQELFRATHSLKSMSAMMGFDDIARLAHKMEDVLELLRRRRGGLSREAIDVLLECLDALGAAVDAVERTGEERLDPDALMGRLEGLIRARDPEPEAGSVAPVQELASAEGEASRPAGAVRVDADRLERLMRCAAALCESRNSVMVLAEQADAPGLDEALRELSARVDAVEGLVRQMGMVPLESVLLHFPRLVRDLAAQLGKRVELTLHGAETELERRTVEALADPLVHLVRNSLDHGLEAPAARTAAGKPETGSLEIRAWRDRDELVVEVRDDGRGVDPEKVAAAAAAHGVAPGRDTCELLFLPGLTTAEEASDVSGRGVGMDAARSAVRALGGDLRLEWVPGGGTTARIRVPLGGADAIDPLSPATRSEMAA